MILLIRNLVPKTGLFIALVGGKASLEVDYSDAIDKSREKVKIPTSY